MLGQSPCAITAPPGSGDLVISDCIRGLGFSLPFLGRNGVLIPLPGRRNHLFLIGMALRRRMVPYVAPFWQLFICGHCPNFRLRNRFAAYSRMGIPFLLIALSLQHWQERLRRILKGRYYRHTASFIIGIMLYTDAFSRLAMLFF